MTSKTIREELVDTICSCRKGSMDDKQFRATVDNAFASQVAEIREKILFEIYIMHSEQPSNYPTPPGQQAVYGILGLVEQNLTNLLDSYKPE